MFTDITMAKESFATVYHPMIQQFIGLTARETRNDWVRLQTLVLLRWMAITGQITALLVATLVLDLQLPLGGCAAMVGLAICANLVETFVFPQNKRLTEWQVLLTLLFDLTQLAVLLYLTGGLTNPFALLILAPVTISASALGARSTLILGAVAIAMVSANALVYLPLRFADGSIFTVPTLFGFGFWLALVIGILFLGLYAHRVAQEIQSMQDALLATQMALSREQKLTDLGGVIAAAAHELGTPLATIKLVSAELMEELPSDGDLYADAKLIRDQADRCRDILRSMGRAGKDDKQMQQAPLSALLREAAEPHMQRGKEMVFLSLPQGGAPSREPIVRRSPEIIHGLRNLIQNAVDFARSTVWIEAEWGAQTIKLRIIDDGPGYPSQIFGRIGDPFLRRRSTETDLLQRPEYEGMGLGLFIAKTLLERTGATLTFANGTDPLVKSDENALRCGAIVEASWAFEGLVAPQNSLGENEKMT